MSNKRGRDISSRLTEDEINGLVLRLQELLPSDSSSSCISIKDCKGDMQLHQELQKEVDDLSDRLSQLLASGDITALDADIIRRLLQQ
ncbi:Transcription factor ILI6 [Sesamum angolense]|uniref:Transcription factor ILI6 n=1 Tax=Sesamum angolense TaxID=2727404 RepID=A0AAE1WJ85_9LAMI|nr:Transcription factor ILI6 [Sesamum angolense]